jgi:hypothetical protein
MIQQPPPIGDPRRCRELRVPPDGSIPTDSLRCLRSLDNGRRSPSGTRVRPYDLIWAASFERITCPTPTHRSTATGGTRMMIHAAHLLNEMNRQEINH